MFAMLRLLLKMYSVYGVPQISPSPSGGAENAGVENEGVEYALAGELRGRDKCTSRNNRNKDDAQCNLETTTAIYRAMHVVLARYCYRKVVRPSVRL